MTATVYTDSAFRAQFPAFANTTTYPQATLSGYWTMGVAYISDVNVGAVWKQAQAQLANDLMAAHLAYIYQLTNAGGSTGVTTGATEGSVSVTLLPPPAKTAYGFWLSQSPYGQQLAALLKQMAGVGFLVGGSYERQGFRKIGGIF